MHSVSQTLPTSTPSSASSLSEGCKRDQELNTPPRQTDTAGSRRPLHGRVSSIQGTKWADELHRQEGAPQHMQGLYAWGSTWMRSEDSTLWPSPQAIPGHGSQLRWAVAGRPRAWRQPRALQEGVGLAICFCPSSGFG